MGRLQPWEMLGRTREGTKTFSGTNIIGVIPGTRVADKYIVVTAHYDHVGVHGDQIYNGADDNASGVATMLEIAARLKRAREARGLSQRQLAALSGVLMGIYLNGIAWNTGAVLLLLMFSAVTLGGLGTAPGALVGALIIGVVADMSSLIIPNDMRYASALAILIIVLLFRPQGILGRRERIG